MKALSILVLVALELCASVYYAKIEPVEVYTIKANTSGTVSKIARDQEGLVASDLVVVQLDDALDKVELARSRQKLVALQSMQEATRESLQNLEEIAIVKEDQYARVKDLKTKAQSAKEAEYIAFLNAQNQAITTRSTLHNLESQIAELRFKIESLEDTIAKKRIAVKDVLVYALHVNERDYVSVGTTLVETHDVRHGKLTLFLNANDAQTVGEKTIYLDDVATQIKLDKLWPVADVQNISSYKAEIIIPSPGMFSRLVKVEFK
ncbi:MAG: hypothetical protein IBX45_05490 [Campylobacterales bacterium]|nr:hypothetical protein [Campylobacterales bacterium]